MGKTRIHAAVMCVVLTCVYIALVQAQTSNASLSTEQQIHEDFTQVPCRNKDRLSAVRTLFEKMGAASGEFSSEKFKNAENLVITKKGTEPGKIVIGAHYDLIEAGCGAIDNWTGIVTMAHVYRSIQYIEPKKTILFVAFGNEENGLFGSHAMADAIPKADLLQYCAMINIDSFGMGRPFVFLNVSSKKLTSLANERAAAMEIPFYETPIDKASADSASFLARKIPSVTLSGLAKNWETIIHSKNDQVKEVNTYSVYLGYRLTLAMWANVDEAPCNAYKE